MAWTYALHEACDRPHSECYPRGRPEARQVSPNGTTASGQTNNLGKYAVNVTEGAGDSVVERAFRILGAFDPASPTLSLTSMAIRTGLPKSSTLRIARKLLELGALEQSPTGDYTIGVRLLEIASLAPRGHGLRAIALPYMEDLHRVTKQHVLLAIREEAEAVLVERLSARDAGKALYRVGGRLPLHSTGVGRVLLAHAPPEVLTNLVSSRSDLWTEPDCRSENELRVLLAEVRRQGYADASRPKPEPMSSVAAPVRQKDAVIAAVSIVAPTGTLSHKELRPVITTVAHAISRALTADSVAP